MSVRVFLDASSVVDGATEMTSRPSEQNPPASPVAEDHAAAGTAMTTSHTRPRRLTRSASSIVRRSYDVALPPWAFYSCWWFAQFYHGISALFTGFAGMAHLFLGHDRVYQNVWLLAIPRSVLIVSGWSYVAVAFAHIFAIVASVVLSVLSGRLTFGYDSQFDREIAFQSLSGGQPITKPSAVAQFVAACTTAPIRIWHSYLDHLLSVRGTLFDATFHGKQLFEVLLQTYQAFTLSRSVPGRGINRLVVGAIVLNCLYTPVVDFVFRKKTGVRRLVNLSIDLIVDFGIAVIVPIWIISPVFGQFDSTNGRFPDELTYNDVWVAHAVSDTRQALVSSKMDYVSSLLPHILGIFTIDSIKSIVRLKSRQYETSSTRSRGEYAHSAAACVDTQKPPELTRVKSSATRSTRLSLLPSKRRRSQMVMAAALTSSRARFSSLVSKVIDRIMLLWVIVVMVMHFGTESRLNETLEGCDLHVNAWLPNGYPCSVFQVNCNRIGSQGASDVMAQQLLQLDTTVLTKVIFSHCEALHVPPTITTFSTLRAIETFNSTIVEWNSSAAVTWTTTPTLAQVQMVLTNFSTLRPGLPAGIFHENTPLGLNLIVHRSNLSVIQPTIGRVWGKHAWGTLWLEYAELKELPESIRDLRISKLSVLGNHIQVLDDALFRSNCPSVVQLSENPLRKLPSEFFDSEALMQLRAENTNVSVLPSWVEDWVLGTPVGSQRVLGLKNTMICEKGDLGDAVRSLNTSVCGAVDPRYRDDVRLDLLLKQRPW